MKEVVFVNQSSGYLMIDIVNEYAETYDEVVLMAGSVKTMERNLNSKVKLCKISAYKRNTAFSRFMSWIFAGIQVFFLILLKYRKHHIVYVTNPPFGYLSSLLLTNPFSVIVYDVYPDALKNIGISENHILFRIWSRLNKRLFNKAQSIFTLSESMAMLLSKYISKNRIKIIHNWSGSENFKPIPNEQNIFSKTHNLSDKFVLLYSGNMGYTHSLEVLMEVAKLLNDDDSIRFLFVGEGHKKAELMSQAEQHNLQNCVFLTWQNADILPYSLASAHLGVVTLNDTTGMLSVPSKTYNLMAAGVPLLSIAPEKSELAILIEKYKNGRNFPVAQAGDIAEFIVYCSKNREQLNEMSDCSLRASMDFHYSNAKSYLKN